MRISEAASRSGLAASTLRYYEAVGLLTPQRTDAGYRDYDEDTMSRLGAIIAAKHAGLGLDDIAELVEVWDGGTCKQTKQALRPRLQTRLADTNRRATGLLHRAEALHATLQHVESLPDSDGPCGPECAFPTEGREPRAIACSLGEDGERERTAAWQQALADATRVPLPDGVRLGLSADRAAEVAYLATAELACCPFFDMELHLGPDVVRLDVHVPPEAADLLSARLGVQAAEEWAHSDT